MSWRDIQSMSNREVTLTTLTIELNISFQKLQEIAVNLPFRIKGKSAKLYDYNQIKKAIDDYMDKTKPPEVGVYNITVLSEKLKKSRKQIAFLINKFDIKPEGIYRSQSKKLIEFYRIEDIENAINKLDNTKWKRKRDNNDDDFFIVKEPIVFDFSKNLSLFFHKTLMRCTKAA